MSGCVTRNVLKNFGAVGINLGFGGLRRVGRTFRLSVSLLCGRRRICVVGAVADENRDFGGVFAVADAGVDERVDVAVLDGGEMTE